MDTAKGTVYERTAKSMSDGLSNKFILATEFISSSYQGKLLINEYTWNMRVHAIDNDEMHLSCTKTYSITDDELKEKMFPWVYDSKCQKNIDKRRDFLKEKLDAKFPNEKYYLGISDKIFKFSHFGKYKAKAEFNLDEYNH